MNATFWEAVILAYYLLTTLLPIDKVTGKLYPALGGVLALMADEGFRLSQNIAYPVDAAFAMICAAVYLIRIIKRKHKN